MTDLQIKPHALPGVFVFDCPYSKDHRGDFKKLFHEVSFSSHNISFKVAESFLTRSNAGVIRGMHFQSGHASHDKVVCCLRGRVLDVIVDVRRESPYFNKPYAFQLSGNSNTALLVPKGYAHGFLSLEDESWMLYMTSTVHCAELDQGVLWSSIDFNWPIKNPSLSKRDALHPAIADLL